MGGKQGKRKSLKRKKKVQVRPVWVALGLLLLSALILLPHWRQRRTRS